VTECWGALRVARTLPKPGSAGIAARRCLRRLRTVGRRSGQRPLAVFFCDLVGSTELSERHGPEEYAYVLKDYRALAIGAIEPSKPMYRSTW
jgi:class 3 adenylate cyclase